MICFCLFLISCGSKQPDVTPAVEFIKIPLLDEGGAGKITEIGGRVVGARPGQRIVLFARSGDWYVQPFIDRPFTEIQSDSTWKNSTHLGTEYAALLVEPDYFPPDRMYTLPDKSSSIVDVAVASGEVRMLVPVFWQTWWFRVSGALIFLFALFAFHRFRLRQLTQRLNARLEERLAERTRITQEIQDTLLQGFLSASMQLHVVMDQLSEDSPARSRLNHVQQLMGKVIEEGRNTIRGMRYSNYDSLDLDLAFNRILQELDNQKQIDFSVVIKGRPRLLHPILRDEVYSIGREALIIAFRRANANIVQVEIEYAKRRLNILIRDDAEAAQSSGAEYGASAEMSSIRDRAEGIGARLKVRGAVNGKTEIELSIPGRIAYLDQAPPSLLKRLASPAPGSALGKLRNWITGKKDR